MSSPGGTTYLDLNVRDLLEKHTIEETREAHRKVNIEIERKREELRMLVGERYRDLIEAADTIGTMRTSAGQVLEKLIYLRQSLNESSNHLLINKSLPSKCKLNNKELELAAEIKLALEIPRQIQLFLEDFDIIQALHLSLLYSRKLDQRDKLYKWNFLPNPNLNSSSNNKHNEYENSILDYCENFMDDFFISPEKLAECIISKQILSGKSCDEIVSAFLVKRIQLCQTISENDSEFAYKISSCIKGLYCVFIDHQIYNKVAKRIKTPLKIQNVKNLGLTFIPKCVTDFNNELISVDEPPPRVSVLAEIILNNYLIPLRNLFQKNYEEKLFFKEEKSLNEMSIFRESTNTIFKEQCEDFMKLILGTSGKSFWSEVFSPVYNNKCKDIITVCIDSIFKYLQEDGFPKYFGLNQNFDLVAFIWKTNNLISNEKEENLKLKCITPHLAAFCDEIEEKFELFFQDFQYLNTEDQYLKEFLSKKIVEMFDKFFVAFENDENILFIGNFTTALLTGDLCPSLWKLMDKNDSINLKQNFHTICERSWSKWAKELLNKFEKDLQTRVTSIEGDNIIKIIPVAEEFVPEEGEENLKASIKVPIQISHFLHRSLFIICLEFAKVGPQSISKSVRDNFRSEVGQKIIEFYEKVLVSSELSSQSSLQFIFDMKFIQWFHPKLGSLIETPIQKLQENIDPFDLTLVTGRIGANIKRFLFENHLTLGLLFSEESHGFIAQNFKTKQNLNYPTSNQPIAISLPLLPV